LASQTVRKTHIVLVKSMSEPTILAQELQTFRASVHQIRLSFDQESQRNTDKLSHDLRELEAYCIQSFADLQHSVDEMSARVSDFRAAIEGEPRGPLEDALLRSTPAEFLPFLSANNTRQFFLPFKRQKPAVLLRLIAVLQELLDHEVVSPWLECALLDLDTQDRMIRGSAPEVLQALQTRVERLGGAKWNMIGHIVRSLFVEFKS
jgi:hypothetical protein